jgi:hypothetical protein
MLGGLFFNYEVLGDVPTHVWIIFTSTAGAAGVTLLVAVFSRWRESQLVLPRRYFRYPVERHRTGQPATIARHVGYHVKNGLRGRTLYRRSELPMIGPH